MSMKHTGLCTNFTVSENDKIRQKNADFSAGYKIFFVKLGKMKKICGIIRL